MPDSKAKNSKSEPVCQKRKIQIPKVLTPKKPSSEKGSRSSEIPKSSTTLSKKLFTGSLFTKVKSDLGIRKVRSFDLTREVTPPNEEQKGETSAQENCQDLKEKSKPSKVNHSKLGETKKTNSEQDQESGTNDKKPRRYSIRLDVVKKTIFRHLKRFYTSQWKDHCNRTINDSDEMFEEAKRYTTNTFQDSGSDSIHLYLVAIIDNKKKFTHPEEKYEQLRTQISSMLSNFNKNKIDALLKLPEFSTLVLHFLSQSLEEIFKDRDDPEVLKIYQGQIEDLKQQCEGFLKESATA